MSFFGKLVDTFVRGVTGHPYDVDDVKLEHYARFDILHQEDMVKLHKGKSGMDCVLYPPTNDGIGYSLFRVSDLSEAVQSFRLVAGRLSLLVDADRKLVHKTTLKTICDTLRQNPTWSCAHVAASLGYVACFRHGTIMQQLSDQDPATLVSPLHVAVTTGSLVTVKELLVLNSRLDTTDAQGNSVFHLAANSNVEMIQFLAGKNRELLNRTNSFGETPLHVACRHGRADCLEALMRWGGDPTINSSERYPIHIAVKADHVDCVEVLYRWCPQTFLQQDNKYGAFPLHWVRSAEMATFLLVHGSDRYSLNRFGDTALHVLTHKARPDCALTLLTHGTEATRSGRHGNTALHLAIPTDSIDLVRALIVFGADIDAVNDKKETARHLVERSRGTNRDIILHTLSALGARRCPASMTNCTEGCKASGKYDGKPQGTTFMPIDARNQLYDDILGGAVICAALTQKRELASVASQNGMDMVDGGVPSQPRALNVLSLDGGGIRGLVLIQILLEIEAAVGKPIRGCFDWIAGTSTGGILALAITYGKSLRYTQGLYFHLKDEVFKGTRPYDSEPLENFMKKEFGDHTRMNEVEYPRVMVSGVLADRHPADLHFFTNYDRPLVKHENKLLERRHKEFSNPFPPTPKPVDQLIWRAARCSGAAPTYFRACGRFLDGGLIANNPCLDLMTEIHEYNCTLPAKNQRRIGCVVSLGTGKFPVQQVQAVDVFRPGGVFELWKTAVGAQNLAHLLIDQCTNSEGRPVDRARAWCGMAKIPFFRFSPTLSEEIPLDMKDNSVLLKMLWETKAYLYESRDKVKELAEMLKS